MATKTFSVRVAKQEAIRLLGEAMRRKQEDFPKVKAEHAEKVKEIEAKNDKKLKKFKAEITQAKTPADMNTLRAPYFDPLPAKPTMSLCDEKQLLTMLRADTRDVIPVPEGSLLWTLIQGKCTPIT